MLTQSVIRGHHNHLGCLVATLVHAMLDLILPNAHNGTVDLRSDMDSLSLTSLARMQELGGGVM